MAQRYPNRTTMNVSDSKWKLTDDLPEGTEVKPASGDDVDLTVNSGVVTQDEDCPTSGALNSFAMAGGQWIDAAFDVFAAGDILISGGTLTSTGTWTMTESGNLSSTQTFNSLVISPTKTATLTGATISKRLDISSATAIMGAQGITVSVAANNGLITDADTDVTATTGLFTIHHIVTAGTLTNGLIDLGSFDGGFQLRTHSNKTFQMTGDFLAPAAILALLSYGPTEITNLDLNGNNLTVNNVLLGSVAANGHSGNLICGEGALNIADITMGNDANTDNSVLLESCSMNLSGTFDGNSEDTNPMTITSVGANLHGGTLLDAAVSGPLHCWGVTKSGVVTDDAMDEGSNAGAALGGMHSMIGMAA